MADLLSTSTQDFANPIHVSGSPPFWHLFVSIRSPSTMRRRTKIKSPICITLRIPQWPSVRKYTRPVPRCRSLQLTRTSLVSMPLAPCTPAGPSNFIQKLAYFYVMPLSNVPVEPVPVTNSELSREQVNSSLPA